VAELPVLFVAGVFHVLRQNAGKPHVSSMVRFLWPKIGVQISCYQVRIHAPDASSVPDITGNVGPRAPQQNPWRRFTRVA
jgi:hypothetical protein